MYCVYIKIYIVYIYIYRAKVLGLLSFGKASVFYIKTLWAISGLIFGHERATREVLINSIQFRASESSSGTEQRKELEKCLKKRSARKKIQ